MFRESEAEMKDWVNTPPGFAVFPEEPQRHLEKNSDSDEDDWDEDDEDWDEDDEDWDEEDDNEDDWEEDWSEDDDDVDLRSFKKRSRGDDDDWD